MPTRQELQAALSPFGLVLRGGWRPTADDALPVLPGFPSSPSGQRPAVVWMVGVAGSGFWPLFKASAFFQDGLADPLDRWSRHVGEALAQRWGGLALFPFGPPPYHPFQTWAARAEPLQASPLMLRMHATYGLWHAYRFALALPAIAPADLAQLPPPEARVATASAPTMPTDICVACDGQPCLAACPVQAFSQGGFQLQACVNHVHQPAGQACRQNGCQSRQACPQGTPYRYHREHQQFHMQAFLASHPPLPTGMGQV